MQKGLLLTLILITSLTAFAQYPGAGNRGGQGGGMNNGRFYGKIVDAATGKPVDAASVQLLQTRMDTVTKQRKEVIVSGQLTQANGDFSLEGLPVMGQFKFRVTAIGYKAVERTLRFEIKPGGDMQSMLAAIDKDLGNIKIESEAKELSEVKIVATQPTMQLGVDRRIFNVDKNLVTAGQTANELMRNVPGVNVDIDGNVTLRNAAPTIFVDGRPTTLTLDQIPSDAIQSVELITNPSAKYDASGGMAGIINIILKKNRRAGYNGSIRTGIDSRARFNLGGDLNVKQDKINFFVSGNFNQRRSIGDGYSFRQNLFDNPRTNITQDIESESNGFFGFGRIGFDYFIDNRNTLTIAQTYVRGQFDNEDLLGITTDSLYNPKVSEGSDRRSVSERTFRNLGTSIGYKRLFTKAGRELTADFNFNARRNTGEGNFTTQFFDINGDEKGNPFLERTISGGKNQNYVFQLDFVNPVSEKAKMEMGIRGAVNRVQTENTNFIYNYDLESYLSLEAINANYKYTDQVYAAYTTYSSKWGKKFAYQLGLRAESSRYEGTLIKTGESFSNEYPISLFPSVFLTYNMENKQDLQLNYSRRINRPNFFQLIPFIDYSDSLNISVGNPGLRPEFTNSFELSYQKSFQKGHSLLATAYYKQSDDLITRFQVVQPSPVTGADIVVNTFINANSSQAYGLELTSRNPFTTWWEVTTNLNLYNSRIDGSNIQENLDNERVAFFAKMNMNFKLPKNYTIQLSGDYQSRTVLPQGGGGFGGGRPWGGPQTTAQGYINPNYGVDLAIRKEMFKERRGSLSISINDIFKTRIYDVHSESPFFIQDSWRRRDWRLVRLNFSYRFGKFDVSLFKRKNTRSGSEGMNDGGMMQ